MKLNDMFVRLMEARDPELTYVDKETKGLVTRVTVSLEGRKSERLTKLTKKYEEIEVVLNQLSGEREKVNADMKETADELFNAEDVVLTRVVDTLSYTFTVSKPVKTKDKAKVDYETVIEKLTDLLTEDLKPKIQELIAAYTEIIPGKEQSPKLSFINKETKGIKEGLGSSIKRLFSKLWKKISKWGEKYDEKLQAIADEAGIPLKKNAEDSAV